MPESFRTRAYDERPSSKLGVADYIKNSVIYVLMPVIGAAVGFGLRKGARISQLELPYDGIRGFFHKGADKQALITAANAAKSYIPRYGEAWGFMAGGFYGAYKLWRNTRQTQLGVDSINESVGKLRGMESSNSYLEQENDQLRQQLSFRERHAAAGVNHTERLAAEAPSELQR